MWARLGLGRLVAAQELAMTSRLERVFPRGLVLGLRGSIYEECVIDGLQTPVFGRLSQRLCQV